MLFVVLLYLLGLSLSKTCLSVNSSNFSDECPSESGHQGASEAPTVQSTPPYNSTVQDVALQSASGKRRLKIFFVGHNLFSFQGWNAAEPSADAFPTQGAVRESPTKETKTGEGRSQLETKFSVLLLQAQTSPMQDEDVREENARAERDDGVNEDNLVESDSSPMEVSSASEPPTPFSAGESQLPFPPIDVGSRSRTPETTNPMLEAISTSPLRSPPIGLPRARGDLHITALPHLHHPWHLSPILPLVS